MAEHQHRIIERHTDVAVAGSSLVGLDAALELTRRGYGVIVIGAGDAEHSSAREELRRHGTEVIAGRAIDVATHDDRHLRVALTGGHRIVARRVLVATRTGDLAAGGTDLRGLFVADAGDGGDGGAAEAARLAEGIDTDLVRDADAQVPAASANERDWDRRYSGEQIWSGNPNGSLVAEVSSMTPGRALDVGAGEGGDAIWLAERGWQVTATDVSARALQRIDAEAARRNVDVTCHHADANAPDAFRMHTYDLVSAHYASIPRRADGRAIRQLLDAVAPGGTLLVVGHDLAPMRTPFNTSTGSRMFDPDAYVRVSDIADAVASTPGWEVEVHELRDRPPGAASHHVSDEILRARRRFE